MSAARLREAVGEAVVKIGPVSHDLDCYGPPVCIIRTRYLKGVRLELRPIAVEPPPKHAVTFMYRRRGDTYHAAGVGAFKDGRWTNGKSKTLEGDLYWTAMVDDG